MRLEARLRRCIRRDEADGDIGRRLRATVARALLNVSELPSKPGFICGAEEDEHAVASSQGVFVKLANVLLVAIKDRENDLEILEQQVRPCCCGLSVALVIDEIEQRRTGHGRGR